jgi:hypothetical protein
MENDRTADYTLMNDLDENTAGYTTVIGDCHTGSGNGFDPIGDITEMPNFFTPFIGTFNGNGNTIDKFCSKNGGLFEVAYDDGTRIENLQMTNAKVENTAENTGALINWLHEQALIQNVGVNGTVNGAGKVGGLVGEQFAGTIRSSYSTATVTGTNYVGGLVGHMISFVMVGDTPQVSHIYDSYATGDVTFDGSADALNRIGGLVGQRFQGNIINSYTTGAVPSGIWESGGLVGGTGITFGGSETNNSYWDTQTTNQTSSSNGGTGKTTAEMQQQATFANWDFGSNWSIDANNYPRLQWQPALASEATSIELRSIYYNGRTIGAPQSTEDNIMSFEIVSPQNPETTPANIAFTFNIYGNSNLNTQQSGVPMKFKIGNNEIGTGSAQVVTTSWAQGTVTVPSSILLESGNILRVDLYMDTTQIMTSLVGTDNLNPGLVRVRGGQIDQSYGSFGGVPIDYRDSSIAGVPQGNTGITGNINVILNGGNGNELVVVNDSTGSEVFRQLGSGGIDLSNPTGIYTVYVDEFSLETNEYLEGVTEYSFLLDSNNTQKTATFTIEQDTHLVTPLVASGTNRIEENRNYPDGLPWGNPATFLSRQDAPNSITINNKHGLFSQAYYTNLGQAYYQVRARATDSNFYIEGPSRYGFKIEGENSTKVTNYTFKVNPIVNANNNIQVLIDDTNAPGIDLSTIEFSINPSSHTNVLGQNALFTNLLDGSTQTITLNTSTIPNGYQIVGGNTNNTQQTTIVAGQTIDISFALEAQATLLNITAGTFPSTNNPHASPITISGDTNSATIQWRGLQVNNLIITPNTPIVTPVGTGTWTIQFNNNYGLETFTVNGSGDNETYTYNSDGLLESRTTNYATPLGNGVTQEEWYYTYVLNNTRTGSRRMVFIADNNNYGIDERIHYFQNSDYIGEARVLYEVINGNPTINSPTIDRDTPITTVTSNGQEFHASTGFVSQRFLATGPQFQNVGTGVAFINPLTQELDIVTNFPSNNTTNLNGTSQTISIVSGVIEI